jgi:hypothetical protein
VRPPALAVAAGRTLACHRPEIGRLCPGADTGQESAMKALLLYVLFVVIGAAVSATIGVYVERQMGSAISLIVFLSLFFANFAIAWIMTILVMDGSLKNAQGAGDQRDAERIGKAKMSTKS